MCIFQHNTAVIPPNMVILTMYSAVREYTTPVKTSCDIDRRNKRPGSGVIHYTHTKWCNQYSFIKLLNSWCIAKPSHCVVAMQAIRMCMGKCIHKGMNAAAHNAFIITYAHKMHAHAHTHTHTHTHTRCCKTQNMHAYVCPCSICTYAIQWC